MSPLQPVAEPVHSSPNPVVNIVGLSKSFGATRVLDGVDLTIHAGEVHGLLGENGSGKSTLIKVLAGFHAPDPGAALQVQGADVDLPVAPGRFRELGISFVHQDLALVDELSVVENLRVGRVVAGSRPWISWGAQRRSAAALFARFGLDIDPAAPVGTLGETERALVAILRAVDDLGDERTLLVLDEPTVFLPREGTDLLFRVVRELVSDGRAAVLLVSHDLDEVREHTDRVTVLRDGRSRGTHRTADLSPTALVELIVGRTLELTPPSASVRSTRPVLATVDGLTAGSAVDVSFTVAEGEVVGLTGIAGSGYDAVLPALYGAGGARAGSLTVDGRTLALPSLRPLAALTRGVVYVPPDRKVSGSAPELSVEENVTLPVLGTVGRRHGLVRRRRLAARSAEIAERYDVRPRRGDTPYGSLSGGNQQKALLGKWLQTGPRLVLLAEPTQGVDVGARSHIVATLGAAAEDGAGIVVASSDYEQLASLCDRVLVLAHGRVVAELTGAQVSKHHISDTVLGGAPAATPDPATTLQEASA